MATVFVELNQSFDQTIKEFNKFFENNILTNGEKLVNTQQKEFQATQFIQNILQYSQQIYSSDSKSCVSVFQFLALLIFKLDNLDQVKITVDNIRSSLSQSSLNIASKLKILSTLYNAIDSQSQIQYDLLLDIFRVSGEESSKLIQVVNIFSKELIQLGKRWKLFPQQFKDLFTLILDITQKEPKVQLDFSIQYLQYLNEDSNKELLDEALIKRIAIILLSNPQFSSEQDNVLEYKFVESLKNSDNDLYQLLTFFVKGDIHGFNEWKKNNASYIESLGLQLDKFNERLTCGAISKIADTSRIINFSDMAKQLNVSEEEVQNWVFLAIEKGILNGRIDEYEKTIEIIDNSQRYFEPSTDWNILDSQLEQNLSVFQNYLLNIQNNRNKQ